MLTGMQLHADICTLLYIDQQCAILSCMRRRQMSEDGYQSLTRDCNL